MKYLISLTLFFAVLATKAQPFLVDRVVATIGGTVVLQSDIESQYLQYLQQGGKADPGIKCEILDQLMINKLLLNQAKIDSVEVTDGQVDGELEKRLRYYIQQVGSASKLEEMMHKSLVEIKSDLKTTIREQLVTQTMQGKITKEITATPSDVKAYFNRIPKDSLPLIPAEWEISHIMKFVPITEQEKQAVKNQLLEIRKKCLATDSTRRSFAGMATIYSDDKETAKKGGELGMVGRGELVKAFEAVAFKLKPDEISDIVETEYGYHLLQLIERRGDQVNVRHILIKPKINPDYLQKVADKLDSVAKLMKKDSLKFEDAAAKYSEDEDTKFNGGVLINPVTGGSKFEESQVDKILFFQLNKLAVGEVSKPLPMSTNAGKDAVRLAVVKSRTSPHRANLKDDYQKIQNAAQNEKQNTAMTDWITKKRKTTFIHICDDYQKCEILKEWIVKN